MKHIFSHYNRIERIHKAAKLWILLSLSAMLALSAGCASFSAEGENLSSLENEMGDNAMTVPESQWLAETAGQYKISAYLTAAPATYSVQPVTYTNPSVSAVYTYPQIWGMASEELQNTINEALFRDYLREKVDWHDPEMNPYIDFSVYPPESLSGEVETTIYRDISYRITLINESMLCLLWYDNCYSDESSILTLDSQIIDMTTGEHLNFSDLIDLNEEMFYALLDTEEGREYTEQHESWWYGATDWANGTAPSYLDESTYFSQESFGVCFPSYVFYEDNPGYRVIRYPYSLLKSFWHPIAYEAPLAQEYTDQDYTEQEYDGQEYTHPVTGLPAE